MSIPDAKRITGVKKRSSSKLLGKSKSGRKHILIGSLAKSEENVEQIDSDTIPCSDSALKYNYRKELTTYFLNDMLNYYIENRKIENTSQELTSITYNTQEDVASATVSYSMDDSLEPSERSTRISRSTTLKAESMIMSNDKPKFRTVSTVDSSLNWIVPNEDREETITFKNGNVYQGETKQYIMHGTGTFTWADGTTYQGKFQNGYPCGNGNMVLQDLSTYSGDFCRGYFHGEGVFNLSSTPIFYKGSWKSGKRHGKGWLMYGRNNSYDGGWYEDCREGFGYRKYQNGGRYRGYWSGDKKEGKGKMIYENNDYYSGDWLDELPHGYGEYTWNLVFNKTLSFISYNWFKGSWLYGVRTGAGIMYFGTKSGAKLAGIWKNNIKSGPGVIISGNGLVTEYYPLFRRGNPANANIEKLHKIMKSLSPMEGKNISKGAPICTFPEIAKLINKKIPIKAFNDDILRSIIVNSLNVSKKRFIKLTNSKAERKKSWNPLDLSVHCIPEEVDMKYFIKKIFDHCSSTEDDTKAERNVSSSDAYSSASRERSRSSDTSHINQSSKFKKEEQLLKNMITIYLPRLTNLYDKYAKIACSHDIKMKPTLVRMFIWQLWRDIGLTNVYSLIEIDLFLSENPSSCYETNHSPFEYLYFWQFLQGLIGCSWLSYLVKKHTHPIALGTGGISRLFKNFLETVVFAYTGFTTGIALTEYRDIVSIRGLYQLYLTIGEPHTVRQFLNHTCPKKGVDPPCYAGIYPANMPRKQKYGYNAAAVRDDVVYFVDGEQDFTDENRDLFSHTLFTFRTLGKKKITNLITQTCPKLQCEDGFDVNYKIAFLEFFEILMLCAYEKAEEVRLEKVKYLKNENIKKMMQTQADQQQLYGAKAIKSAKKKKPKKQVAV